MDTVTDAEGSMRALSQAFLMIIASEIGDKTFLIVRSALFLQGPV